MRGNEQMDKFEFPVLLVLATLGMLLMVSANSLISLYLGLELQSLALYVVAAINRESVRSTEAGLKYFVLGALSSGMLLYGMSLVYGFTGQVGFTQIAGALQAHGASLGLIFGLVFVMAGIAFKISAVPFHMWTPDVYEGAPTPVTAFFAAAPKVAAMAMLVRIVSEAFQPITIDWQQIVVFISIASMLLGAFAAIGQTNIKRLMAYSSIGHMGYALVGLSAGTQAGVRGVALYMLIYMVMTLGTFACILAMRRKEEGNVELIEDLAGLASTKPVMATMLTILMFSLAGVPPLAGFFAKYFVFVAAIQAQALRSGRDRRPRLGGRRLLLSAHRQDHVVRRAGRRVRPGGGRTAAGFRPLRPLHARLRADRRPGRHGGRRRRQDVLLTDGVQPLAARRAGRLPAGFLRHDRLDECRGSRSRPGRARRAGSGSSPGDRRAAADAAVARGRPKRATSPRRCS